MTASIKEIYTKIKHFYTALPLEVLFSMLIILVGFAAFGLGRLSALVEAQKSVQLSYDTSLATQQQVTLNDSVVASKNGAKYCFPWCGGVNRISQKNKITFKTVQDARNAGYLPARNCRGLE